MYSYNNPQYRAKVLSNLKYALIATLLLALLATVAQAQEKIEGLGPFKINVSTVALVEQIAADMKTEVTVVNDDGRTSGVYKILEYKRKPNDDADYVYMPNCPDVRVFLIRYYTVSGIAINNLRLTFYKNKLIALIADGSSEIAEAMQIKYGIPVVDKSESKSYSCEGAQDEAYTSIWKREGVVATTTISTRYDNRCQKRYSSLLHIYTAQNQDEMRACEKEYKDKANTAKKKTLKDF